MLILKVIVRHFSTLTAGFNTVVELDGITKHEYQARLKRSNNRFVFAALIGVTVLIGTIINIVQTNSITEHYMYVLTRIWPASIEQRNIIALGAYIIHPWFFINILFERWPHLETLYYVQDRRVFSIDHHDQALSRQLSDKILGYYYRYKNIIHIFNVAIIVGMNVIWSLPYYVSEMFFPNSDSWSARNVVYMIITPIHVTYLTFGVIYPNCFWLHCHYIRIVQDHYIDWLKRSIVIITRRQQKINMVYPLFNQRFWDIFEMMKDVSVSNRFWSKYITCTLAIYCMEVCYIYFTMVTAGSLIERLQLLPMMTFATSYLFYIYTVSFNCSMIYQNNSTLHRYIRMFLVRVSRSKSIKVKNIHRIYAQHSFEQFFRYNGFRLLNGFRINNRMFEFIFTSIAIFSLKLFGKKLVEYF